MRLSRAVKLSFALLVFAAPVQAADAPPPSYAGSGTALSQQASQQQSAEQAAAQAEVFKQQQEALQKSQAAFLQNLYASTGQAAGGAAFSGFTTDSDKEKAEKARLQSLGDIKDPSSGRYKSEQLAAQAERDRNTKTSGGVKPMDLDLAPPPEVETLQNVNESMGGGASPISDELINKDISADLRKEAQKEAALSYGARGGLAKRSYEIMESMKGYDGALDKVFNFRALLISAPSGLMIEPPIVKAADDALVITEGGNEAAVANEVFDINKQAKIVSAPRDWRQYLIQVWSDVPPPPRILWPKTPEEQASWNGWVRQGWKAGYEQAEQIFEMNTNRLAADFSGMVRYRMLLSQGMISEPYAMHEDRGVTGDKKQMRVGDRALRITGPSQFLMGADLWKPADR